MGLCYSTNKINKKLQCIESTLLDIRKNQLNTIQLLQKHFISELESINNPTKQQICNALSNNLSMCDFSVVEQKPNIYVYYDRPITISLDLPQDELIYMYPNQSGQLPGIDVSEGVTWHISDPTKLRYLFWEGRNLLSNYQVLEPNYIIHTPTGCIECVLTHITEEFKPDERLDFMTFWVPKLVPMNIYDSLEIKIYINNHPRLLSNSAQLPTNRFYMIISRVKSNKLVVPNIKESVKLNRSQNNEVFEWGGSIDPSFHIQ
jgi:hypothetical protein